MYRPRPHVLLWTAGDDHAAGDARRLVEHASVPNAFGRWRHVVVRHPTCSSTSGIKPTTPMTTKFSLSWLELAWGEAAESATASWALLLCCGSNCCNKVDDGTRLGWLGWLGWLYAGWLLLLSS